jgi:GGDEF domain-containing protein
MDKLRGIIGSALRRSDIFTRYSLTQYLIMLPSSNYENGERVLDRICSTFRHECKRIPAEISYNILPVDVQL